MMRELVADGAPVTYKVVYKQLVRSLPEGGRMLKGPISFHGLLSCPGTHLAFLFLREFSEREAEDQDNAGAASVPSCRAGPGI
jgi:hypothetical protein